MAHQSSFQSIFDQLLTALKLSQKVVEVSANFTAQKPLDEIIDYLWNMENVQSCIWFTKPTIQNVKDKNLALNLRNEGNKHFRNKSLEKAIDFYNGSIVNSICNDANEGGLEGCVDNNLGICFANRSAILFELGYYELCLKDITRAVKHNYPTLLRCKLVEREAKCFISLGNGNKAHLLLNNFINNMDDIGIEKSILEETKGKLEHLKHECKGDEGTVVNNCAEDVVYSGNLKPICCDVPKLNDCNPSIPSFSSAIELSISEDKGRHLRASRDIYPGELLICEKSFASISLPNSLKTHCSYCLQRTWLPIPCPSCTSVVYCDEACRSEAWTSFHSVECPILTTLLRLDMGQNAILALRLLVHVGLERLQKLIPLYVGELPGGELSGEEQSGGELSVGLVDSAKIGFNEGGVYASDDYRPIYSLVTNKEKRTVSDLFKRGVMAFVLTNLLNHSSFFTQDSGQEGSFEKNAKLVCETLFIHLMNLPCNAHSITELSLNLQRFQESHVEEIGAGAFASLSLINHSCNPSVDRTCYGDTVASRAIRFIPKGCEISDSYGQHFAIHGLNDRQIYLKQQYCFSCLCEACLNNWLSYENLEQRVSVLESANGSNDTKTNEDGSNDTKTNKNGSNDTKTNKNGSNATKIKANGINDTKINEEEIEKALIAYNASYTNILKSDVRDIDLENITKLILLLSKFAKSPSKTLFEAQETLKHCYDRTGSRYFVNAPSF